MSQPVSQKPTTNSFKAMLVQKQAVTKKNPYISREFQDYGYQLAERLGDLKYKSLYIKLAKTHPRSLLESAYSYVADYPNANNKGKLFMWRLKKLAEEAAAKTAASTAINPAV